MQSAIALFNAEQLDVHMCAAAEETMHPASSTLGIHGYCRVSKETLPRSLTMPARKPFFKWQMTFALKGESSCSTPKYWAGLHRELSPSSPFNDCTWFKGKGADSLSYEREMRRNLFWCVPYRRPSAPSNILLSINFLPGDKCSYNQGLKICKSDREKQRKTSGIWKCMPQFISSNDKQDWGLGEGKEPVNRFTSL